MFKQEINSEDLFYYGTNFHRVLREAIFYDSPLKWLVNSEDLNDKIY